MDYAPKNMFQRELIRSVSTLKGVIAEIVGLWDLMDIFVEKDQLWFWEQTQKQSWAKMHEMATLYRRFMDKNLNFLSTIVLIPNYENIYWCQKLLRDSLMFEMMMILLEDWHQRRRRVRYGLLPSDVKVWFRHRYSTTHLYFSNVHNLVPWG